MQVQYEWQELPAVQTCAYPACPLQSTSQYHLSQMTEGAKWIQGLDLMTQVLKSLGTVDRCWYGWVKTEGYTHYKEVLDDVREQYLDQLLEGEEDRSK